MNRMSRHSLTVFMLLFPCMVNAQWAFDVLSIEAYIHDHKQQRSLLLARSTLELSNRLLHEYSSEATVEYKTLNVDLDRYTRAFDVIDILYQSLRTGLNIHSTYNTVSERIEDYKVLLEDYREKVLARKRFAVSDTLIISINLRCIRKIADEGEQLYRSVSDLLLYATGVAACSTSELMVLFGSINTSLDNIERHLNRSYLDTWRYIQLRMGYWKDEVYGTKSRQQLVGEAFERWRKAGLNPHEGGLTD